MRKYTLIILSLVGLYSCSVTVPVVSREEVVELSKEGDYIRPIRTSNGYYYNDPKDGKLVKWKRKS